ncbi:hypothetical protein D3C76_1237280 [compost metagenome]
MGNDRAENHRDSKGHAEAHANKGHRFGAILFASQIGKQRHDRSGDGAGTLQCTSENDAPNGVGEGGNHTTKHKYQQPANDKRFTANAIGEQTKGDLKDRLSQTVNTDGKTN